MLKKIYRLSKKKDFLEIKEKGVLYHSPIFSLAVLKSPEIDSEYKLFGVIISKKISNKAVSRNKIKRYLNLCVQNNWDKFKPGTKAIFLVRKTILNKELEEINKEVAELAAKIK